jgi:diadenosine tetraphosphate (Ap4A) HIT family hydrolase
MIFMTKLLTRDEYYNWLLTIPSKTCAFCKMENHIYIKRPKYWSLIFNIAPYWKYHLLLIPKRHVVSLSDLSSAEIKDMVRFQEIVQNNLLQLKSLDNRKPTTRVLFFWRYREDRLDPIYGVVKPDHLHLHAVPEQEHMWDDIVDQDAVCIDTAYVVSLFNS